MLTIEKIDQVMECLKAPMTTDHDTFLKAGETMAAVREMLVPTNEHNTSVMLVTHGEYDPEKVEAALTEALETVMQKHQIEQEPWYQAMLEMADTLKEAVEGMGSAIESLHERLCRLEDEEEYEWEEA